MRLSLLAVGAWLMLGTAAGSTAAAADAVARHFDFGSGPTKPGYTQVPPMAAYSPEIGYGFEANPALTALAGGLAGEQPFSFSVKLPEGNYEVAATLGNGKDPAVMTVKAEGRRLMIEQAAVPPGGFEQRNFTVNIRTPRIDDRRAVKLTRRELGPPLAVRWDDKLTLEFNGSHPGLSALDIVKTDSARTVYLAGDSTVTEQPDEPWAGWGQMLSRFFRPGVAVANHAESGLALNSFQAQQRLAKILTDLKPGDYLFIQFGHNDQKEKTEGAGPFTTYKQRLKTYVQATRDAGGNPVLVTPMERRRFDYAKPVPTLADYAEAVRQVGTEDHVPVVDLNRMSLQLYEALGPEGSTRAFVHYPAGTFPGQSKPLRDDTHHNAYGGYELARCVVEGIKTQVPELAKSLVEALPAFDPAHPDPAENFKLPPSPSTATEKPAGN